MGDTAAIPPFVSHEKVSTTFNSFKWWFVNCARMSVWVCGCVRVCVHACDMCASILVCESNETFIHTGVDLTERAWLKSFILFAISEGFFGPSADAADDDEEE